MGTDRSSECSRGSTPLGGQGILDRSSEGSRGSTPLGGQGIQDRQLEVKIEIVNTKEIRH